MKFSFINPSPSLDTPDMVVTAWPPLGMLYIAEVLLANGIEASILDQAARRFSTKQTLDWVKKENPDILGFSVLNSSAIEAPLLAERVKKENPNVTIVFGNYHATFNAERILRKYPSVDVIVRGEGESTSLDLAKCLEKNERLEDVKGITFRKNGKIVATPDRPLIKDVDSLSFPNRDLVGGEYSSTIYGVRVASKKFTTIVSSRGCPFQCTFCACRKFARGLWRPRTVENIIKELQMLKGMGYEQFLFVDDNFTLNIKRVVDFCRRLRKEKLDIEWFCDSRVDNCRYDMMREMVKAGCRIVYFGIESGNKRILNYYRKGITPDESEKAVKNARKAGVDVVVGSFILGAPDETKREIENTLKFVNKLDIDVPQLNILGGIVGTDLWAELVSKGYVDEEQCWERGFYVPKVSPHAVPFEEINRMIYEYFKAFYLRPGTLSKEILRTFKSSYRLSVLVENILRVNSIVDTVTQGIQSK
jgi:radical SAM superfamily enzyme YgiQ (UPF0313 family)